MYTLPFSSMGSVRFIFIYKLYFYQRILISEIQKVLLSNINYIFTYNISKTKYIVIPQPSSAN